MTGRYHIGAAGFEAPALTPQLYLVATPIGNLGDVTIRALETLAGCDVIYCEDTRVTARLLERYGIKKAMRALHDHNEYELAEKIVAEIAAGKAVTLVSDAGTPLISDPGFRLVKACVTANVAVTALPGASAVLTGLQLSGLATDAFTFIGFLPQSASERQRVLSDHVRLPQTTVAYESPHRLRDTLADIAAILGARPLAVARELTKLHEEVLRGSATEILDMLSQREAIKGECVVVIAGQASGADPLDDAQIARIIAEAAHAMPAGKAAQHVARLTGLARDEAFSRILKAKGKT